MRIELLEDYRGIKTNDALWPKGIYDVADEFGDYLIGKGYARSLDKRGSGQPVQPVSEIQLPDGTTVRHVVEEDALDVKPDGIAQHNQAVDDLGLPSHLKVAAASDAPETDDAELARLQAEYEAQTGDAADGRWGINRLHEAILELAKTDE